MLIKMLIKSCVESNKVKGQILDQLKYLKTWVLIEIRIGNFRHCFCSEKESWPEPESEHEQ